MPSCCRAVKPQAVCGDGTFRLMHNEWVLISIGTLTKHYAQGEEDSLHAFQTTFDVIIFVAAAEPRSPNLVPVQWLILGFRDPRVLKALI